MLFVRFCALFRSHLFQCAVNNERMLPAAHFLSRRRIYCNLAQKNGNLLANGVWHDEDTNLLVLYVKVADPEGLRVMPY